MARWVVDLELAWATIRRRPREAAAGSWAIAVAVGTLVFVLALGNGLQGYLQSRLLLLTPALWVEAPPAAPGQGDVLENTVARLQALPDVAAASAHAEGSVLLSSNRTAVPVKIDGYQLDRLADVLPALREALRGRAPGNPGEIVVGETVAHALRVTAGDVVVASGAAGSAELTVVGALETGIGAIDAGAALADVSVVRALTGSGGRHGVAVAVHAGSPLHAVQANVQEETGLWTRAWHDQNRALLEAMAVEAAALLWISLAAVATAAVATAAVTYLRVGSRRYEIAVVQAMGATPARVARTLLLEAVGTALVGAVAGILLALAAAAVVQRTPIPLPASLGLTQLPVELHWRHVALGFAAALAAAIVASSLPAVQAARAEPARALHHR